MEDNSIIQLYWDRDERAVAETAEKYGGYCKVIAKNILGNDEDALECVNDTYLSAWNAMPTHRPERLCTFLGKLTRNISFNKYKHNHAEKRGGGQLPLILDEPAECVSGAEQTQKAAEEKELLSAINSFIGTLSEEKRSILIRRYWYADSIEAIAHEYGKSVGSVTMVLKRTREKMKIYLSERGFEL